MPFSSRKSRARTSSVNQTTSAPSASSTHRNPFTRLRADRQIEDVRLLPTSNLFHCLEEVHLIETVDETITDDHKSSTNTLEQELESLSFNTLGGDRVATRCKTSKLPSTVEEEAAEINGDEASRENVSKKNDRDQHTQETVSIVKTARSGIAAVNWRTGNGPTYASGWNNPGRGYAGSRFTGRHTRYGAGNIFFGISVAELCEGVIIWHMQTTECYAKAGEGDVFSSPDGQKHFRKGRFSVVISVHSFSLEKVSMFTYNGKGIMEKKSEEVKKEHIGVRPKHISPDHYLQQNEYAPLEIDTMNDEAEQLHERSVVHLTKADSLSFDTKIRIVGYLTTESTARVKKLRAYFGC